MKSERRYVRPDTVAAARLQKAIADGGMFHAYLFEGSSRSNEALADWFAAAALCERRDGRICGKCVHCRQIADGVSPYIVRIKTAAEEVPADERFEKGITENPAGSGRKAERKASASSSNKIKDSQVEEVISRAMRSTLSGETVLTIIDHAETITPKGQNRLLKILEEPPEGILIILLTSNAAAVLETIRSRCVLIRTDSPGSRPEPAGKPAFRKRAVSVACELIKGTPSYLLWKEIDYFSGTRERAMEFCGMVELFLRDVMMYKDPVRRSLVYFSDFGQELAEAAYAVDFRVLYESVRACETALRDLDANVSMKHALRLLMFSIQLERNR